MEFTREEVEKLIKENNELKKENATLKNNHGELLTKFNCMVNRLDKLEESRSAEPAKQHVSNRSESDEISQAKGEVLNVIDSIKQLQDAWSNADVRMDRHSERMDDQDQYSKKNSLIVYSLDDIPKKT